MRWGIRLLSASRQGGRCVATKEGAALWCLLYAAASAAYSQLALEVMRGVDRARPPERPRYALRAPCRAGEYERAGMAGNRERETLDALRFGGRDDGELAGDDAEDHQC